MKSTTKQPNSIRRLQRGLYKSAKMSSNRRFAVLYDKVYRDDVLHTAWTRVRSGGKASGVDGVTVEHIENVIGLENFLEEIENELKTQSYKPQEERYVRIKFPQVKRRTRFRQRIKMEIKSIRLGTPLREVIKTINRKLRGWAQYYRIGNSYKSVLDISNYACMQLRLFGRISKHRRDIRGTRKWSDAFFYTQNLLYLPGQLKG